MNKRIPQLLNHYGVQDNERNRLIAYNAGIKTLIKGSKLKQETTDYINKYEKFC
jgi:hypothetical protein